MIWVCVKRAPPWKDNKNNQSTQCGCLFSLSRPQRVPLEHSHTHTHRHTPICWLALCPKREAFQEGHLWPILRSRRLEKARTFLHGVSVFRGCMEPPTWRFPFFGYSLHLQKRYQLQKTRQPPTHASWQVKADFPEMTLLQKAEFFVTPRAVKRCFSPAFGCPNSTKATSRTINPGGSDWLGPV